MDLCFIISLDVFELLLFFVLIETKGRFLCFCFSWSEVANGYIFSGVILEELIEEGVFFVDECVVYGCDDVLCL